VNLGLAGKSCFVTSAGIGAARHLRSQLGEHDPRFRAAVRGIVRHANRRWWTMSTPRGTADGGLIFGRAAPGSPLNRDDNPRAANDSAANGARGDDAIERARARISAMADRCNARAPSRRFLDGKPPLKPLCVADVIR
jgi:hypothetical protein